MSFSQIFSSRHNTDSNPGLPGWNPVPNQPYQISRSLKYKPKKFVPTRNRTPVTRMKAQLPTNYANTAWKSEERIGYIPNLSGSLSLSWNGVTTDSFHTRIFMLVARLEKTKLARLTMCFAKHEKTRLI